MKLKDQKKEEEDYLKNMTQELQTTTKESFGDKLFTFFFGKKETWKRLPQEFKQLGKDLKNPAKAYKLIITGLASFLIMFMLMATIAIIQDEARFCKTNTFEDNTANYKWWKIHYTDDEFKNQELTCWWDFKKFLRGNKNG